jgi:branched-chain amino acid transport system ATP-binding protein
MLEVRSISVSYGAAPALWDIGLDVAVGELVCVVGPNGAGKTTLINAIAGLHRVRSGQIRYQGEDITQLPAHRFCDKGIALVPEGRRLFTQMSVLDNLELGSFIGRAKAQRKQTLAHVLELFPALKVKLHQPAGSLSGGQQQMVAIGRGLMAQPGLLLLDEPSLGLSPLVVQDMFNAIRQISHSGTSILLVEQNVSMAMALAQRAYVVEEGRIVMQGPAQDLLQSPAIQRAYLGLGDDAGEAPSDPQAPHAAPTATPTSFATSSASPLKGPSMNTCNIGLLVGSLRRESINKRLADAMVKLAPPSLTFHPIALDELPMYNGDLEANRPEAVNRFTAACARMDGMLIVTPEFNRSLPAVLKNAIDWGSKPMDKNVWRDKTIAAAGTTPGAIGTAAAQLHLRQVLGALNATVIGGECYVTMKPGLIDEDGTVTDETTRQFLQNYINRFASFATRLAGK